MYASTTDPEARLARKSGGQEAKLTYCGNVLIENRNGLVVDVELFQSSGTAEREVAQTMIERVENTQRITLAADKGYDTKDFVATMRERQVTPHVAQNENRRGGSAMTVGPHGILDMGSARVSANGLKKSSVDENGWHAAQDAAPWCVQSGMGFHLCVHCL